ncbi:unnamed protein product [Nezara viridula]|uniref:StAR-related lipid transfer protein 3 n=1 Tax=Nezara viridula TaxID=85310 RepID=A0A9P0HAR1_NEZVI|nr:unnamed protein product [Nezara viridula]
MTEHSIPETREGFLPGPYLSQGIFNNGLTYNCGVHSAFCTTCHAMSEDVARGIQVNGRMSAVRRFFCLFVTFDVLLTSLIWLICLVLAGNFNFTDAFYREIVHYSIKTSLSDVVMASLARFIILLFFYGLLHIDHWIIVAITTVGTCCFSVEKVYIYDWTQSQQVLSVLLILSSFILSWAEGWLLDIKVIPQERSAQQFLTTNPTTPDERTPLIRSFLHNHAQFDVMSDSVAGTFYSPVESPAGSDDESDRPDKKKEQADFAAYVKIRSNEIFEEAWSILNNDKWTVETTSPSGDVIYIQKLAKGEKIFRLIGVVEAPISLLIDILYHQVNEVPLWNPTVKESKFLQKYDENVDVIYQLSAEAAKGLVSSREFILLRNLVQKNGYHIIATCSVKHPSLQSRPNVIRAENGSGCWALKQVAAFETEVRWLLNTNIRGWLPQSAVESALLTAMSENMANIRRRALELRGV